MAPAGLGLGAMSECACGVGGAVTACALRCAWAAGRAVGGGRARGVGGEVGEVGDRAVGAALKRPSGTCEAK